MMKKMMMMIIIIIIIIIILIDNSDNNNNQASVAFYKTAYAKLQFNKLIYQSTNKLINQLID